MLEEGVEVEGGVGDGGVVWGIVRTFFALKESPEAAFSVSGGDFEGKEILAFVEGDAHLVEGAIDVFDGLQDEGAIAPDASAEVGTEPQKGGAIGFAQDGADGVVDVHGIGGGEGGEVEESIAIGDVDGAPIGGAALREGEFDVGVEVAGDGHGLGAVGAGFVHEVGICPILGGEWAEDIHGAEGLECGGAGAGVCAIGDFFGGGGAEVEKEAGEELFGALGGDLGCGGDAVPIFVGIAKCEGIELEEVDASWADGAGGGPAVMGEGKALGCREESMDGEMDGEGACGTEVGDAEGVGVECGEGFLGAEGKAGIFGDFGGIDEEDGLAFEGELACKGPRGLASGGAAVAGSENHDEAIGAGTIDAGLDDHVASGAIPVGPAGFEAIA